MRKRSTGKEGEASFSLFYAHLHFQVARLPILGTHDRTKWLRALGFVNHDPPSRLSITR